MAHFEKKNSFCLYLSPFTGLIKNSCLNKSNFPQDLPLFKYGKKNKLSNFFGARLWDSYFYVKKKFFYEFPQKCFQTTEKHSLKVCVSFCGEKLFFKHLTPLPGLMEKKLFKQIQIFLMICPFSNMVRKSNCLSISVHVSEIVTFLTKKRSSLWISQKNATKEPKGII